MVGDPLRRRLRPHLVDAGHVVHRVADQGEVVDDAPRRHAELRQHARHVERLVAHRVDQRYAVGHELREILVAGGDDHALAAPARHVRQRADGVVGLDAGHFEHRPAEQLHHFADRLELLCQRLGHGLAVGLVVGIPGVAKGGPLGVEHADRMAARHVRPQLLQHGHHAVDRPGGHPARAAQVGQCVIGPVEIAGSVDQQQGVVHIAHRRIVARPSRRRAARRMARMNLVSSACLSCACVLALAAGPGSGAGGHAAACPRGKSRRWSTSSPKTTACASRSCACAARPSASSSPRRRAAGLRDPAGRRQEPHGEPASASGTS